MAKSAFAILIVAAGNSSRLGQPKQLLDWESTTLLNHTIAQAQQIGNVDVFVLLGSNYEKIMPTIPSEVNILINSSWSQGMGSSIAAGITELNSLNYEGVILSVCDQPYIDNSIFVALLEKYKTEKPTIVVSQYKSAHGPPTFFHKQCFAQLMELQGHDGAKRIVKKHKSNVAFIQFENGDIDIDTKADLDKLLNR